jgi:hypothetical protein
MTMPGAFEMQLDHSKGALRRSTMSHEARGGHANGGDTEFSIMVGDLWASRVGGL